MTSKAIFKKENHESNYGGGILDENLIHETSLKLRRSPPTVTGSDEKHSTLSIRGCEKREYYSFKESLVLLLLWCTSNRLR